jgi:hypothetical protein
MAKIATLGSAAVNASEKDRYHALENIDIMGNGPKMKKIWIYAGLAFAAYLVYKNKGMA